MHKNTNNWVTQEISKWSILALYSFSTIVLMIVLLTSIPNPIPLIVLLIGYATFVYLFRLHKAKLLALALFFIGTVWVMLSMMDTRAVSLKCSPELRKQPENRSMKAVELETKNFESCLSSITLWDNIKYGLLE